MRNTCIALLWSENLFQIWNPEESFWISYYSINFDYLYLEGHFKVILRTFLCNISSRACVCWSYWMHNPVRRGHRRNCVIAHISNLADPILEIFAILQSINSIKKSHHTTILRKQYFQGHCQIHGVLWPSGSCDLDNSFLFLLNEYLEVQFQLPSSIKNTLSHWSS